MANGRPGRPRKTAEQHSLAGTLTAAQKKVERLNTAKANLTPLPDTPEPPAWIGEGTAKKEWLRLVGPLMEAGILNAVNLNSFAMLCKMGGYIIDQGVEAVPDVFRYQQYRIFSNDFMEMSQIAKPKISENPFLRNRKPQADADDNDNSTSIATDSKQPNLAA